MIRPSLRKPNQMRPVSMETAVNKWAEGSCLIKIGGTHVPHPLILISLHGNVCNIKRVVG